jgi:YD repeat-containing protein
MSEASLPLETEPAGSNIHKSRAARAAAAMAGHAPTIYPQPASVEWDHKGRVIRSRFANGHISQFRYDQQGSLYAFTYAGLAWNTTDGVRWSALDHQNTYSFQGKVTVLVDGTIEIEQKDLRRCLKLSGMIIDDFLNGTHLEHMRETDEPMPGDLLAVTRPRPADFPMLSMDGDPPTTYLGPAYPANFITPQAREAAPPLPSAPPAVARLAGPITGQNPVFAPPNGVESGEPTLQQPKYPATPSPVAQPTPSQPSRRRKIAEGLRVDRMRAVEDKAAGTAPPLSDLKKSVRKLLATSWVRIVETVKGPHELSIAASLDVLAQSAYDERRVDESRILHERALQLRRRHLGSSHPAAGVNLHGLGRIYHEWGRYTEAEHYYLDAVRLFAGGVSKARFLVSIEAAGVEHLYDALCKLLGALHSLSTLYHEHKKRHLCEKLYDAGVEACAAIQGEFRTMLQPALDSMAAMVAHAAPGKHQPDDSARPAKIERPLAF